MPEHTPLPHRIVSPEEMAAWPVDRSRTGRKQWAEVAWGCGPQEGPKRLLFNFNVWPCRVVFEVPRACEVARAEALWRRSKLSIRMKGLKLLSAATGKEITDAVLVDYDQERVVVDFAPVDGPGLYHLYYGAAEGALFDPSGAFGQKALAGPAVPSRALRIEARSRTDDFDAMERIATAEETAGLLSRHGDAPFMVFPQDRDCPIKLQHEIPAVWAHQGPQSLTLQADRHEYRVFQLGVWACRADLPNVAVRPSDLGSATGAAIPAGSIQCLTLESRSRSQYIIKPAGRMLIPKGQVRALWFGIDIPADAKPGVYEGSVTVEAPGLPPTQVPLRLQVSNDVVAERGDHDLWRLSRLRWLDSDVGLSDEVYPPYQPLRVAGQTVRTWGHSYRLSPLGLVAGLKVGGVEVLSGPMTLRARLGGRAVRWSGAKLQFTRKSPNAVDWTATAASRPAGLELQVRGHMEFDGCIVYDLQISPLGKSVAMSDLTLAVPYDAANAWLGMGMGYRGRREGDRCWRRQEHAYEAKPRVWMGSLEAGLLWATGLDQTRAQKVPLPAWDDDTRADAATITAEGRSAMLRANLGRHRVTKDQPWRMQLCLLPTPVKPSDLRHWDFRYMHKGGWFLPDKDDTPHSYLADGCKRLDEACQYGVKRLNLHDWWGPAFNCAWQWDREDNVSKLTEQAHRRGMFVKVYSSGREMSNLAPYFWPTLFEATQYQFRNEIDPAPRLRFQDAWAQNHLPDGIPEGWTRLHPDGTEHCSPVSNATRNGNLYLETMRYMTRFFGTDGAYWDGADGPTLGFREMAKRLWTMFHQTNPNAATDVHHGHPLVSSPMVDFVLCLPFIDSLWHGEGFNYDRYDPWGWLVEIAALPFGVPSEMLDGVEYTGRGMLFGIWPRPGWGNKSDAPGKIWRFFDRFDIKKARMLGWWEDHNGVAVDKPLTYVTAYRHPRNGVLLAVATWIEPPIAWMEMSLQASLRLDRGLLGLPKGKLAATDIISGEDVDIEAPVGLPDAKFGRLIWVRSRRLKW